MVASIHTIRKSKICPITCHEVSERRQRYSSILSSVSIRDVGGRLTPVNGHFTPWNGPVLIIQEAGWAPVPVWKDAKILSTWFLVQSLGILCTVYAILVHFGKFVHP